MNVDLADHQVLLEFVGEAYSFDGMSEFRTGLLELLGRAVPSDWMSYNEIGAAPEDTVVLVEPVLSAAQLDTFARLAHENPILAEIRRTGDGRPRRFSDLVSRETLERLALYQDFYRPLGVETQVAFTLPARPPLVLGIAMCRGWQDYSGLEMAFLARARPYLIQAYRNAELASARSAAIAALEGALESLEHHVVLLDRLGRIEIATAGARRLLGELGVTGYTVPEQLRDWLEADSSHRAASTPLVLRSGGTSVLVRRLPAGGAERREVLLLEAGQGELSVSALSSFGLTRRQAEALRWAALGKTGAEMAQLMGIARRTVDKHLQAVYALLGVSSRAEAGAVAWAAVGITGGKSGPSEARVGSRSASNLVKTGEPTLP